MSNHMPHSHQIDLESVKIVDRSSTWRQRLILEAWHSVRDRNSINEHIALPNIIVIIRNWLGNPANFKGTNKDQKIYVGKSTTLHNLLFCTHSLWPNYVTVTFLLVSSSGTNHDLLCLCRVMAKKRFMLESPRPCTIFCSVLTPFGRIT